MIEGKERGIPLTAEGVERIKHTMVRKGLTQKSFAEKSEIGLATIKRAINLIPYETFQKEPKFDIDTIRSLAEFLDLYAVELVDPLEWYKRTGSKPEFIPIRHLKLEDDCYQALLQPPALIRIKSPQKMGKSMFVENVIKMISQSTEFDVVELKIDDAMELLLGSTERDRSDLLLNKFLQWFCIKVTRALKLPDEMDKYWDEKEFCIPNTTHYFTHHVLRKMKIKSGDDSIILKRERPLLLILENTDWLFTSILSDYICRLFRYWFELSTNNSSDNVWRNLRLVIIHSTEIYGELPISHSPLNVGKTFELPDLEVNQVVELARREGLDWQDAEAKKLTALVEGYPFLIHHAIKSVRSGNSLNKVLKEATTEDGIFANYLRGLIGILESSSLTEEFKRVVIPDDPVQLLTPDIFKLYSMGLVQRLSKNHVKPRCALIRDYFCNFFTELENRN